MAGSGDFLINISVLNRNMQKYFDKALAKYEIGSGQLLFLLMINEHEGISMQEVAKIGEYDKGTTTKGIQRLIDQGFVTAKTDENDRRIKRLYTTQYAAGMMNEFYDLRNECMKHLAENTDINEFQRLLSEVTDNSRLYLNVQQTFESIKIGGLQKVTLLDYPGKVASTIFTGGCNFKCPYCHNRDLVFLPEQYHFYEPAEVLSYLEQRTKLIDGVCISGGEPLLQNGLIDFIKVIREKGYLVKLDTNGYFPDKLKDICDMGLIDYVAMDIKNCRGKYGQTVGLSPEQLDISRIEASIAYLMQGKVDYEFRTTLVRGLHEPNDIKEIGGWIKGAKRYYLQQYMESENVIQKGWSAYSYEEMLEMKQMLETEVQQVELRGVKGV